MAATNKKNYRKPHRWRCLGHDEDGNRCRHRLRPGTYKRQDGRCRAHKDQQAATMETIIDPAFEETRARLDPGPPIDLLIEAGCQDLI